MRKTNYNNRRRYVGAYMIIECYRDNPIPIISVNVTSVANSAAVASVRIHPTPFILNITRGVNIFIVCDIKEAGVNVDSVRKIMFIGDMSSVQSSTRLGNTEYVVNLTDNRRYLAELPSYYLKLIRSRHDAKNGVNQRSNPGEQQSPVGGYTGENGELSLADEWADANFYGIGGEYYKETSYYDITDSIVVEMLRDIWEGNSLNTYIRHMMKPLFERTGWEPYYVNMNKKKRISGHLEIYDDGLFQADIKGKFAEAAFQSIKDSHSEMSATYGDALSRLSELGYIFNTNIFPSITGGQELSPILQDMDDPDYILKSTLFPGELINIVKIRTDDEITLPPDKSKDYAIHINTNADKLLAKNVEIYSTKHQNHYYYAIVNREKDGDGANVDKPPYVAEFNIVPKMYGVLPPKCNWEIVREGVTLNIVVGEPPITALKYDLKDGLTGSTHYSYSYPGEMEICTYIPPEKAQDWEPVGGYIGPKNVLTATGGFSQEVENAIEKVVAPEHRDIVRAIMYVESRGNPSAVSYADARGIMQVHYPTWKNVFDFNKMGEIEYGLWAGYQVFLDGLRRAKGNLRQALWYYNHSWDYVDNMVLARYRAITRGAAPKEMTAVSGSSVPGYLTEGYHTSTQTEPVKGYRQRRVLLEPGEVMPLEDVYGKKRVSTTGPALYELEKASQYAETSNNDDDLVMTQDDKFKMLRRKVVRDFYESTVSRNTGTVSIEGLAEDVVVGFPYIIYYAELNTLYYGFVNEVSHRIDNSAGKAYTEIALGAIIPIKSIRDIEENFSGYTNEKYIYGKDSLKNLNKLYAETVHSENITEEEYLMFDLTLPDNHVNLIKLLTTRPGHRNICTLERLQNYMYSNLQTVAEHNDVAGSVSPRRQWMTKAMIKAIKNVYNDYVERLSSQINGVIGDLVKNSEKESDIMGIHEYNGPPEGIKEA